MFVQLTPDVLVDPTEVAAVTQNPDGGSRLYMRGSGTRSHIVVGLPVADVSAALAADPSARRPGETVPQVLRRQQVRS